MREPRRQATTTNLTLALSLLLAGASVAGLEAQENAVQQPSEVDQSSAGNTVQAAQMLYHQGVRDLDRALDLVAKAGETDDEKKSAKLLEKSVKANESAVQRLTQALQSNPRLIDAYAALGLAYRRLDKYQEALEVHAIALRRDPESLDNFRGWSESLLALDMLGNATAAYENYAESEPERAAILMQAIENWLAVKQADPGELDPEHIERLAAWVGEQSQEG